MLTGMWKVTAKKNFEESKARIKDALLWELLGLHYNEALDFLLSIEKEIKKMKEKVNPQRGDKKE